jgi:hypothetical protein
LLGRAPASLSKRDGTYEDLSKRPDQFVELLAGPEDLACPQRDGVAEVSSELSERAGRDGLRGHLPRMSTWGLDIVSDGMG